MTLQMAVDLVSLQLSGYPRIQVNFTGEGVDDECALLYERLTQNLVKKLLPPTLFEGFEEEEIHELLTAQLPVFQVTPLQEASGQLSFYLVNRYRANASKFFLEMINRWLIPGKRLDVLKLFAADFCLPDISSDLYTICELTTRVESEEDLATIQQNLPIIESEICLGVTSNYGAQRVLEVKGLTADEKTSTIQEHVVNLVNRRPTDFDVNVYTEMQHVLVMCRDEFKHVRECRHLSRIIGIQYLFRKWLRQAVERQPNKRHLTLKIVKARLHLETGLKTVLGVIIGVNFLRDNELMEERHILKAVQNYVPNVKVVEGSFFSNGGRSQKLRTLYLEIEKANGEEFSSDEVKRLRKHLPGDLKDRIEHLMHPVFMPRNEEEIMRYILMLSSQLKYSRDMPQVVISFDEQTDYHLSFTVILLRVLKKGMASIQQLFSEGESFLEFIPDRCRTVGYVRKKYPKEATVFRLRLPKARFLRNNHSIDLYKARQLVAEELHRVLGDVRDFNGGMISKQNELLCTVRDLLGSRGKSNEFLLENFFYSLNPVIMRTVLEPHILKNLFLLLLSALEEGFFKGEAYCLKSKADAEAAYAVVTTDSPQLREVIKSNLSRLELSQLELATTYVNVYDTPRLGYILRDGDQERQGRFLQAIAHSVEQAQRVVCA